MIKDKKLPKGVMFWSFVSMYGLLRTLVELVRQPDEQVGFLFGYFTMGQLLSIPVFLVGVVMIVKIMKKDFKNGINPT